MSTTRGECFGGAQSGSQRTKALIGSIPVTVVNTICTLLRLGLS
jgi:hypothetical protein